MNQKLKALLPTLEEDYPGISEKRLKEEFDFFKLRFLRSGKSFTPNQILTLFSKELKTGRPLGYINNRTYFYNTYLYVDERVLIPRFESEILVEKAREILLEFNYQDILEVGCGSGALSFSLAREVSRENTKSIRFSLSDISLGAISVAEMNYHNLQHHFDWMKFDFIQSDLFINIQKDFDFIISNPPYIKRSQIKGVHKNVVTYEPDIALFLEDENHDSWFEKFFTGAYECLKKKGHLLIEGHEDNLNKLITIAEQCSFKEIQCINDLTNRKRFLLMRKI